MLFRCPQKSPNTLPKLELKINSLPIEQVLASDFLGLVINDTLTWKYHINKISLKISKVLSVMRRIKYIVSTLILLKIYNSFILPRLHMHYLAGVTNTSVSSSSRKKAIGLISKSKYNAHTDPLYNNFADSSRLGTPRRMTSRCT